MTIAALQYDVLRLAWPVSRAAHSFSDQDEAEWAATMDLLWNQMTPMERQSVETDREVGEGPRSPQCAATFEGERCAYERSVGAHVHWTITESGEVTWTEESLALEELSKQFRRIADGLDALADAAARGPLREGVGA